MLSMLVIKHEGAYTVKAAMARSLSDEVVLGQSSGGLWISGWRGGGGVPDENNQST